MKGENTLTEDALKKIESIKNDRAIVRCTSTEIKDRLKLTVSTRYINVVLSGEYIGNYNNEQVVKILDTAIDLIEEKKRKLSLSNQVMQG